MFQGLWFFCQFGWKTDKRYIAYNVLYQFVHALIPLINIAMPKYIIEELLGAQRIGYLALYVGILTGYNLLASGASEWLRLTAFTLRCKVSASFDLFLHAKLADADYANIESAAFLDRKEKANKYLYGDWHGFSYVFDCALGIIGQFFTLAGIAAIVATLNGWIVLLFTALAICSALVDSWAKRKEMKLSLEQVKTERGWMYYLELFDQFAYGKEIRVNSLRDWLLAREKAYAEQAVDFYRRRNGFHIKSGFFSSAMSFIQQGIAYVYLVARVLVGGIGIGDFTMYIGAVTAFSGAMRKVMTGFVEVRSYSVYYDAMREYLNVPDTIRSSGSRVTVPASPNIEFRDVSFRYAGQADYALRHVNFTLRHGEKLSIVGENGAGKTTFVKLLSRLYDPTEGEILLNGVNIREFDYDSYMSLFSTVFQDFKLFSFSLAENVCLALPRDDGRIRAVLARVGLSERLKGLPKGIETAIYQNFDDTGFEPSGGEGQRIALARALYRDAPVVVLDEPTAALDPRAEYEIYRHFNELVAGKTAVFISHRLASARFCDRIAVFCGGRITECGTHAQLIGAGGKYAQLFGMQARFYV